MAIQTLGIAPLIACSILFIIALWLVRRDKPGFSLALIVLAGLLLRVSAGSDRFLHAWDERYHALVAKNLIAHPLLPTLYDDPILPYDYRRWDANHVWIHKQPVPLWTMALSMRCFGVNELALRLPSILLSTIAVALTGAIGSMMFGTPAGLIAAFLHAINGLILQVTAGRVATDHIDLFHLFFVEIAVFLALLHARTGRRAITPLIGLAVGIAILCKWLTALIALPLWLLQVRAKDRPAGLAVNTLIIAVSCCATFLPWQIYTHAAFPLEAGWESAFNVRHITEALEGHAGSWFFHFRGLRHYGEFIYLPIAWFLFKAAANWRDTRFAVPAVWFVVPFAFFTVAKTKMDTYTLFTAPAIFVMAGAFIDALAGTASRPGSRILARTAIVLLIAAPVYHLTQAIEPLKPLNRSDKWAVTLRKLGKAVPEANAVFFTRRPIETMFYTSGTAYEGLPTEDQIADLKARGYNVYIVDSGKGPASFRSDARVTVIDLKSL